MQNYEDEFGDLSQFKILSFEEVSQGFEGNKNPFKPITTNENNFPDYRSPLFDMNKIPIGASYLTDEPISDAFPFTGKNENGKNGYEYRAEVFRAKMALKYWEATKPI